jgi:hypothetical protein
VEVMFRTFIPSEAIHVPGYVYPSEYVNGGDGRGFSSADDASFRTSQSAVLNFGPNGEPISGTANDSKTGITKQYHMDYATGDFFGWAWDLTDGAVLHDQKQLDPTLVQKPEILTGVAGDDFILDFHLSATNPLEPPAYGIPNLTEWADFAVPSIDAEFSIAINQDEAGNLSYSLDGTHDGFPAYELYINDHLIYSHDPIGSGEGPLSLAYPMERTVAGVSGTIDWFLV